MSKKAIIAIAHEENQHFYRNLPLWQEQIEIRSLWEDVPSLGLQNADLLLIDCAYDTNCGLDLLSASKEQYPTLPILFLTDVTSEETAISAFRLGARDYFKNPPNILELKETIEAILELKRCQPRQDRIKLNSTSRQNGKSHSIQALADTPPNILRAIRYMNEQLHQPLYVDKIAREAGLSKFHFCRVFKSITGLSPMSFLTCLRIERAKSLLKKQLPVTTVAIRVGYDDLSNFSRQFKHHVGITPALYKESEKSNNAP